MALAATEAHSSIVGKMPTGTFLKNTSKLHCVGSVESSISAADFGGGKIRFFSGDTTVDIVGVPTTKISGGYAVDTTIDIAADLVGTFRIVFYVVPKFGTSGATSTSSPDYVSIDYSLPSISSFFVRRANASGQPQDDGTRAIYTASASVSPLDNTNTANYELLYREMGASTWTTITLATSGYSFSSTNTLLAPTFAANKSYEFQFVVTDSITNAVSSASLGSAYALWHFNNAKNGIGVGKYSETENLFDVGLSSHFRQGAQIDGGLTLGEPLPKAGGGLGADVSTQDALLQALGIRRAVTVVPAVPGKGGKTVTVSFSTAFATVPTAIITNVNAVNISVNGYFSYAFDYTKSGFSLSVVRSGGSGSADVSVAWIAIL